MVETDTSTSKTVPETVVDAYLVREGQTRDQNQQGSLPVSCAPKRRVGENPGKDVVSMSATGRYLKNPGGLLTYLIKFSYGLGVTKFANP